MANGTAWKGLTDFETVGPVALGPAADSFESLFSGAAEESAAVVGQLAVVGSEGAEIPVAILNSEIKNYQTKQGYKRTNEALKYLREYVGEAEQIGVPSVKAIEMTHTSIHGGGVSIPIMTKDRDGLDESMDWRWKWWEYCVFDWKAMLKNLPTAK